MKKIFVCLITFGMAASQCRADNNTIVSQENQGVIVNGVPWFDQNGNIVNAHGAGIVTDGGRYWLFGEYKSDTSNAFPGFGCYSSDDLVNWRFERVVLPVQKDGVLGPNRVGERPKVMRCPKTGDYVMFAHADDLRYMDPNTVVATSMTINGDYELKGTLEYNGKPIHKWDIGVFQDDDGKGYLLVHHGPIYRLKDNYLSVDTLVANVEGMGESPAMFKKDGIYYLLTSNLTSWERNDNYYFTATDIAGPWTRQGLFCPQGTLTWNSQTTSVLMLPNGTPMYMGDRWSYPYQASAATYVWLPLKAEGTELSIPEYWQTWLPTSCRPYDFLSSHLRQPMLLSSNHLGESVSQLFRGRQVVLVGTSSPHGGYAKVTITDKDGISVHSSLIDFYSKVPDTGYRFVSPRLPLGEYSIKVEVTGERSNWTDKRKNLFGTDDCYVETSDLLVIAHPIGAQEVEDTHGGYLFAYFINNTTEGQQVCYALSRNGLDFEPLNEGRPVIASDTISRSGGVRDPHLLRTPDGWFLMVLTDMDWQQGKWSCRGIVMMRSRDLIHWQHQTVHFPERYANTIFAQADAVWAPQTLYDPTKGKYMVYFSLHSPKDGPFPRDAVYYAYANSDFSDLEDEPQSLFNYPDPTIDTDIVQDDEGMYHLFFNTWGAEGLQRRQYIFTDLHDQSTWTLVPGRMQPNNIASEGSTAYLLADGTWLLGYDCFQAGFYQICRTDDWRTFQLQRETKTTGAFTPRHGSVLRITEKEYCLLKEAFD